MNEASSQAEHAAGPQSAATIVLHEEDVGRALTRIAHELAERNSSG